MRRFLCVTALLGCVVLAGCGPTPVEKATQQLIGRWQCHSSTINPEGLKPGEQLFLKLAQNTDAKFELTIRDTGTMTFRTISRLAENEEPTKNWKVIAVDGDQVTVELANVDGGSEEVQRITLIDDDHFKFRRPNFSKELPFVRLKE